MKKWMNTALAISLMFSLSACGDSSSPAPGESASAPQTQASQPAASSEPENTPMPQFQEQVLIDNEACRLTVTDIEPDNMWGYTLKVLLENKSGDVTYSFAADSGAVDGIQCTPLFVKDVAPGKKANEEITFSDSGLKDLVKFTDVELQLRIHDANDWAADPIVEETVHVYPFGEEKAETFVREQQESDTVLFNSDAVTVVVTGYGEDPIWGYEVNLFLMNKTEVPLMYSVEEAAVNGFMMDPFFATTVEPGKCAFKSMNWSDSDFKENGVSQVEEIEFRLKAYDSENWSAPMLIDEVVTLNP